MKQEQVIELAVLAGLIEKDYEHGKTVIAELARFASLVEQATLERAVQVCDEFAGSQIEAAKQQGGTYCNLRASGAHACSMRIRNLAKDSE